MNSDIPELKDIYLELKEFRTVAPVTKRNFLSWFEVQRRTYNNVTYIDEQLNLCDLQTVPSYVNIWVDTPITFELISQKGKREDQFEEEALRDADSAPNSFEASTTGGNKSDPSFKVGRLKAATRVPISVKPSDPISRALTIMITRNFSQLPVMTNEREVKGVISWISIGERQVTGRSGSEVRQYMNDHHEIRISTSMFAAIKVISEYDYVLIRDAHQKISGIVTAYDIAV